MPKILTIDDKMDNLVTLSALLKNLMPDCAVITAQSGIDGIEKAKAGLPDVILLDVRMPDMDGFETCRRLKSDEITKHIPVIMITAMRQDPQSRIKGLEIGADAFLSKPIDEYELVSQVKVALRIKKVEDALRTERNFLERLVEERTVVLKEKEERLRSLVESTSDWIWAINAEGRYFYASPQVGDFLGYKPDEVLGKAPFDFMPQKEAERVKRIFQEIQNTRRPFKGLENLNFRKNGEPVILETSGVPIFDAAGNFAGYYGVDRDISEQKKVEEELKNRNKFIETILDNLPIGLAVNRISETDAVIYMNKKFEEIYGWTKEEIKSVAAFFEKVYPGQEELKERVMADIATGDPSRMKWTDLKATGINGDQKIISAINIPIIGQNLMISTVEDITGRKRAEEEKSVLEAQLLQAQKLESIGTLAGGIAHDFNNILSAIIGYSELALDHAPEGSAQYRDIREVLAAGNRAKELVKQILTFARYSDVEMKPIRAKYIVQEALKLLRSSIPSTIEIQQYIDSDAIISANTTQIHQMVMNLCTNAAHAMEAHGGILNVHLDEVALDNNFAELHPEIVSGNYLQLSVQDTGYGMAQDVIEKVFNPYFTTKKIGEGTGLGLSVVKGIVDTCNGLITVKSELGKGCIFDVYLPVLNRETKVATGPVETEKAPTGDERILFVDDEPPIAIFGEQLLGKLGYQVEVRTSAVEALKLFKTNSDRFDLVITDMTMPHMTGDVLAAEIRKIRPDIPVILCTGYSKAISDERAKEIGINAFLMKPVVNIQLAKTVRKVLDEAKG